MDPVTVLEKREHAEKLIQDGYYADAVGVLEELARNRSPKHAEHAKWARELIPKVRSRLKKARLECQDACTLAIQLYDECNYAGAVEVLEKFKRGSRSAEAEEVLRESKRALKKVTKLNEKIDQAIYRKETDTDDFFDTVEELLELDPKDRRARQLHKKLEEERREENYLGWQLGVAALGLICLVAVGWVIKLIFWPGGEGSITVKLTEPGYAVVIDGQPISSSELETKLTRFEPGDHKMELRRGGETVYNYTFTIEANIDKTLEVPTQEEIAAASESSSDPLPTDVATSPLDTETNPLAAIDPPPMDTEMVPEVEPMEANPQPQTPMEPTKVNGFPLAKPTGYTRLEGPRMTPNFAVFSSDVTLVAADHMTSDPIDAQKTYDIPIWDTATGKVVQTVHTTSGLLQGIAFSPDGKLLATAHANTPEPNGGMLQIWNVEDGALAQSILFAVPPGKQTVEIKGVAFSRDSKLVALINQDQASAWVVADGSAKIQKSMAPQELTSVGFFPVGEILILGVTTPTTGFGARSNDGVISWDIPRNTQRGFLSVDNSSDKSHPTFTISPDLSVITVLNGNSIRRFGQNGQYISGASLPTFAGDEGDITFKNVSYSPSGVYVMATARGRRPLIWRDSDFDRTAILGDSEFVGAYAAAFTPDSKFILQLDRPENTDDEPSAAVIRTWQIEE